MRAYRWFPSISAGLSILLPGAQAQECNSGPATCGQWDALVPMQLTPPNGTTPMQVIHAILLRTGKVLCIDEDHNFPPESPEIVLFDPGTSAAGDEAIKLVFETYPPGQTPQGYPNFHDMFCSGHTALSDGRIFFSGGGNPSLGVFGTSRSTVYVPIEVGTWEGVGSAGREEWDLDGVPPIQPVETRRWYPSCTTLGDGTVLVTDGGVHGCGADSVAGNPNIPVVLEVNSGPPSQWTWNPLYLAEYNQCSNPPFDLAWYPFIFQLNDGRVFMAGSHYANATTDFPLGKSTLVFDVGAETWSLFPNPAPADSIKGGSAVMFQVNGSYRIMKSGGGTVSTNGDGCLPIPTGPVTNRAFIIDPHAATPAWTEIAPMHHPRLHFYLVALPDGNVLAVGGTKANADGSGMCSFEHIIWNPESYNPHSNTWTAMAPLATPRQYHSVALLLPDGSVFTAGGQNNSVPRDDQVTYQIFKPPYFFQGPRPTITSAPAIIRYNRAFNVDTPEAPYIQKVRLIRTGAATHSFDQNQRALELGFTQLDADTIRVTAPAQGNIAPPGYYMLFIATGDPHGDRPSTGRMIQLLPPATTD
jgi:Domain of unknown function (DUF1929)